MQLQSPNVFALPWSRGYQWVAGPAECALDCTKLLLQTDLNEHTRQSDRCQGMHYTPDTTGTEQPAAAGNPLCLCLSRLSLHVTLLFLPVVQALLRIRLLLCDPIPCLLRLLNLETLFRDHDGYSSLQVPLSAYLSRSVNVRACQ
jgi:hypothetical protein